jgi:hypothetical protein
MPDKEPSMRESAVAAFNFTRERLARLESKDKVYRVKDTGLKGLICRVRPSGRKSLEIYKKPRAPGRRFPSASVLLVNFRLPTSIQKAIASWL